MISGLGLSLVLRVWKVRNGATSSGEHGVYLFPPPPHFFSKSSSGLTSFFTVQPIENPVQDIILLQVLWITTHISVSTTCSYFSVHSRDNKEKTFRIKSFIELENSPVPIPSAYRLNYPPHSRNEAKNTPPNSSLFLISLLFMNHFCLVHQLFLLSIVYSDNFTLMQTYI